MKFSVKRKAFGTTWYEHLDTEKDDMKKWAKDETKAFLFAIIIFIIAVLGIIGFIYLGASLFEEEETKPLVKNERKMELKEIKSHDSIYYLS